MVLEKTLESPLDCKEIQPVHSEGYYQKDIHRSVKPSRESRKKPIHICQVIFIKGIDEPMENIVVQQMLLKN